MEEFPDPQLPDALDIPCTSVSPSSKPHESHQPRSAVFGDYVCVLKGYSTILSLEEMKEKASHHQLDVPREKKLACCSMLILLILMVILISIYFMLLDDLHYDIQDSVIISLEVAIIMSILLMGMCCLRWISFNDISSKTLWDRVAVTIASPLKMIEFDMENVDLIYYEYNIDYGQYPHKLHEPIVTLIKKERICNDRDLVKIALKESDPDEAYSYGAIYFHYKGTDEYLLDRWKYEFGKHHNKVANVHRKCNKFHRIFSQHFGYKYKYNVIDDNEEKQKRTKLQPNDKKKYHHHLVPIDELQIPHNRTDDEYVMDTHDFDESDSDNIVETISPILLGQAPSNNAYNMQSTK